MVEAPVKEYSYRYPKGLAVAGLLGFGVAALGSLWGALTLDQAVLVNGVLELTAVQGRVVFLAGGAGSAYLVWLILQRFKRSMGVPGVVRVSSGSVHFPRASNPSEVVKLDYRNIKAIQRIEASGQVYLLLLHRHGEDKLFGAWMKNRAEFEELSSILSQRVQKRRQKTNLTS